MSYTITADTSAPNITDIQAAINSLDARVTAASTLTFPFINITQAPYSVAFDGTDETSKWQAALTAVATNGGTLYGSVGAGDGESLVSGAGLSVTLPTYGVHLWLPGVRIKYSGIGTCLSVTMTGSTAVSQLPSVEVYGLNIACSGAAQAGIQMNNCTGARLRDVIVTSEALGSGSVVYAYVFYNTGNNQAPHWSEDISMTDCAATDYTGAAIAFNTDVGNPGSFARFVCRSFYVSSAIATAYVIDVQAGNVYDSKFDVIRGNFSGAAIARIRTGANMEGSHISGIYTEGGSAAVRPYGFVLVDTPDSTKLPVVSEFGNYVTAGSGWVGPWITGSSAPYTAFTPPAAMYKAFTVENPVVVGAPLTAQSVQATGGPTKSLLQAGSLAIGANAQSGSVTTTSVLWAAGGGAAGEVTVFVSAASGAGGGVAKATFAGAGAKASYLAAVPQNAARPGYYQLTITSLTVNADGTVSFGWAWGSAGAPATTMTWTVMQESMPI